MPKPRLLIVEDEAVMALDLKLQLEDLGYEVQGIAASAEQALAQVRRQTPDLVLMDIRLQGALDGIEAAHLLQIQHPQSPVPVIFLTSHSDDDTVQRAARTGPYGYLTKPYQIRELRAGIEVALTKSAMQKQLREADRWFAQTLQCVTDGVVVSDLHGRVRFINPAAEALTGWRMEQAVGVAVADIVRFEPRAPDAQDLIDTALQRGRPMPVRHGLTLRSSSGALHCVDETAAPVKDEAGQPLGSVLVLRDASQRVAQEARLRASEERFRHAFDDAPLGMALVSLAGEIIQVNEALCRLLGSDAARLRRLGHAAITAPEGQAHEQQRLQELAHTAASVVQFERDYLPPGGGGPLPTLVSVSLLRDAGQASCYLYQVHDLRAQHAAAQQLADLAAERMRREASELAHSAKTTFLSRVSHEMRTPLNAVVGFAQLLQMQKPLDPEKVQTYASHILSAGEHMLALVSDLLDLNRAGQVGVAIKLQPVVLASVVQESLMLVEGLAGTQGISLHTDVALELVVMADPTRLRQVLLNVLSNAIKYNREAGSVTLRAGRLASQRVWLKVQDTGVGMTSQQQERLFQPFERLGQERTRIPGSGLGLIISRSLIQEMGGSLELSSEARHGTQVTLELPAAA